MLQRRDLLVQIAKLYYIEHKTQQEIADVLFLSRSNVSRLLKICVEKEIVEFYINETTSLGEGISSKIKEKYGLEEVLIAPLQKDEEYTQKVLGQMVANYLRKKVVNGMKIGVTHGSVLHSVAMSLSPVPNVYVDVVQMSGNISTKNLDLSCVEITKKIAQSLNGDVHIAYVPYKVNSGELKNMLLNEREIKIHFSQKLDMAVLNIESPKDNDIYFSKEGFLTQEENEILETEGVVAHVCGASLNKEGECCAKEFADKFLCMSFERIKKIPHVIGVCMGGKKSDAISSCLKSGIINTIAIDERGANALL